MQERTSLEDQLTAISRIEQELDDQVTMIELGDAESDQTVVVEAEAALRKLRAEVARRELEALLSGEADANDCYLEVHAGAGGTESQDWASMLLRMYVRWAEQHGFKVDYIEETAGEEAGIKSATIEDQGPQRLWLAEDRKRRAPPGAHFAVRLQCAAAHVLCQRQPSIRWSTTASRSTSRKRMFGSTRCAPAAPAASTSTRPKSAIRLTHIPTNIVVVCQNDRSQHRNRAQAWQMLRAKLYEAELRKREEKAAADQAAKTDIGWGHQIRSYVLQPYQMVKDLRTGRVDLEHRRRARRRHRSVHGSNAGAEGFRRRAGGRRGRGVSRPRVTEREWQYGITCPESLETTMEVTSVALKVIAERGGTSVV